MLSGTRTVKSHIVASEAIFDKLKRTEQYLEICATLWVMAIVDQSFSGIIICFKNHQ